MRLVALLCAIVAVVATVSCFRLLDQRRASDIAHIKAEVRHAEMINEFVRNKTHYDKSFETMFKRAGYETDHSDRGKINQVFRYDKRIKNSAYPRGYYISFGFAIDPRDNKIKKETLYFGHGPPKRGKFEF